MKVLTTKNDSHADIQIDLLADAITTYLKNPQNTEFQKLQSSNSKCFDNSYYKLQYPLGYCNLGKRALESTYFDYWVDRGRFLGKKKNRSHLFSPFKSASLPNSSGSLHNFGMQGQWCGSLLESDVHRKKSRNLAATLWTHSTHITGTSGNTSSAVVTNSGSVFVGSVAANDADYNRSGELIYYKNGSVLYLNGHFCQQKNSQEVLRQTVSNLKYCPDTDVVFSAGYDGKLKVWSEKSIPDPISEFSTKKACSEKIHSLIAKHPNLNVIGFGSSERYCYFLKYGIDSEGSFYGSLVPAFKRKHSETEEANRIDIIEFSPRSTAAAGHFDFFALTGYCEKSYGGAVEFCSFRDGTSKLSYNRSYVVQDTGVSCSSISSDGKLLAVGTGAVLDDLSGDGHLHLCDGETGKLIHRVFTKQYDCDFVTWSPCNRFFASGNSIDNVVKVYDIRFAKDALASLVHTGEEKATENVMVGVWSLISPGLLFTGGADRKVKVWNVLAAQEDSLKAELAHSFAVNSLAMNPRDESQIVVGTMSDFTIHSSFAPQTLSDCIFTKYCY